MQQLTGWLIFVLSCIGQAELWVMMVNRSYAFAIDCTHLRKFRALHDFAIVAYPFWLLWSCGLGTHGLLTGGSFTDQTLFWRVILVGTLLATIPFFAGILRWQWVRRFQFHKSNGGEVFDVAAIAKDDATLADVKGSRWHPVLAWPWNEVFSLEVNRKTIRVANPGESSRTPLRIAHFSDLHFINCPGADYYRFVVRKVLELNADAIVFTGDLIDEPELLQTAIEILRPLTNVAPCFFVLGNHDWRYDYETFRSGVAASGWQCVTGTHVTIPLADRKVLFAGSERPWIGDSPPSAVDADVDVRILLSHSPDQYRVAQKCGYDVMLSGHTHGGQFVLPIIGPVYAPSIHGVSFAAGLFRLGPLTLHVSRGIGAKDPLRWRCRPELTCLEIH
ncbi:MAG TPA: metallophosphoesterase [Planctomycetaceae bacterium]|nr:metallophosphoesterase [Planctomycetaceae bacterium]